MTLNERKTFLHSLERKLSNFRKRVPIYCQCLVLFDEEQICITIPSETDSTIKIPVDFSVDVSDCVKEVHDILQPYYPVLSRGNMEFYLDKVDFKSNSFVIKSVEEPEDWAAIYQMKQPVSLLLKKFQSSSLTSFEKNKIFESNILKRKSEEDYLVL